MLIHTWACAASILSNVCFQGFHGCMLFTPEFVFANTQLYWTFMLGSCLHSFLLWTTGTSEAAYPGHTSGKRRKKKEAKQNLDKDHAALEAASGIFGDRGGYVRHELELAEQAGVDDNIVCEQFARLFCGQHTSIDSPLP
ncbi:hypothetical protein DUNSADRAFT_12955 [Dunaliella salina]|uniref:Uncharacterized protein n=1 Tax=Dunaliella salina TaxID=3046 RepID=A0ABQ7GAE7_DUNSA|nr:hypothetical protein DUNSADRAFT_12955 [Dunaliella salina]|eukprot:KAF5831575.1 hypothetical protein DUNSADRAFT_12955 [Dunaliella salina]